MAIKIVTDSGADIPIELANSLGITVVPLTLSFGEQTYLDGVDLSPDEFYEKLINDSFVLEKFIFNSLVMKKKLIEIDEFDSGPRNVMNYGHSFGHAIESATNYTIPHGIAVTIGMDIANYVAAKLGVSTYKHFERMHDVMDKNCHTYRHVDIDVNLLMLALSKDKKNSATQLRLILPDQDGCIHIGLYDNNDALLDNIKDYFAIYGGQ